MTTIETITLIIAVLLAGVAIGAVLADTFRALYWLAADGARSLRGPARVYVPVPVPVHPRFGPLTATPPGGIEVTRDDGVLSVKADQPVTRKWTRDHAPTGEFAAVPYAPPPPSWAGPVPTTEELREDYFRWQQAAGAPGAPAVTESVSAWRPQDVAAYGTDRCEADVDEAQRLAAGLLT
jgi:hypothetical protein